MPWFEEKKVSLASLFIKFIQFFILFTAEVYLNTNRASNELYHENYDCVAVMFASLTNYSLYDDGDKEFSELRSLEILNQIICDFDSSVSWSFFIYLGIVRNEGFSSINTSRKLVAT